MFSRGPLYGIASPRAQTWLWTSYQRPVRGDLSSGLAEGREVRGPLHSPERLVPLADLPPPAGPCAGLF